MNQITSIMKKYEEYLQAERQYSTLTLKAYREDIGEFVNFFSQNGGFKDFSAI
ncbi:site-specific integrase, partial [Oenococcus oeni]